MRIALGTPISLDDITKHCKAFSKIRENVLFTHITTDSREAVMGDLFFSLTSNKSNADEHIREAKLKGAITASSLSKEADFMVNDSEKALLNLATYYKSLLKSLKSTVAITGSVGKTTTKEFVAAMVAAKYKTHKTYMNYNNALGLSLSMLTAPADTEILILELGMNGLGEIKTLSEASKPDFAVITNIGTAHIGKLGSRKLLAKAKMEISEGMTDEKIIVPFEEALLQNQRYKFSLNSALADFYLEYSAELKTHTFYHKNQKIISFSTPYKANHHLSALAIAISIATLLELNKNEILSGIKNCENISFRQKLLNFKNFSVFDDTYSSSIEAIKSDIEYLKLEYPKRSLSFALGDILELGTETFNIHKSVGNLAYYAGAKKLYAFGSYAYLIREGAEEAGMNPNDIYTFTEPDYHKKAAEEILKNTLNNEIVLVKASHALHSEKIIEEIERLAKEC